MNKYDLGRGKRFLTGGKGLWMNARPSEEFRKGMEEFLRGFFGTEPWVGQIGTKKLWPKAAGTDDQTENDQAGDEWTEGDPTEGDLTEAQDWPEETDREDAVAERMRIWEEAARGDAGAGRQKSFTCREARSVESLQQAMLWSEILGEPAAKKRRKKRVSGRYGN